MGRLYRYAKRYRWRIFWGCLMLIGTNASAMVIPQLLRFGVDGIMEGVPGSVLRNIAWTMLIMALVNAAFRVLSRIHLFYAARDVELDLRCDFYRHLAKQPPSFFEEHATGDLMSRATNDLGQIRLLLGPGVLNLFNTALAYGIGIPLMMGISVKLTLISLAIYPFALLVVGRLSRHLYQRNRRQQEEMGRVSNFVQESLAGAHVIRAFGIGDTQARRFRALIDTYYQVAVRLAWVRSYLWRLMVALAGAGVMMAVYFGAYEVMAERISLGELVALVEYLAFLSWPTFAMGWILSVWQRGAAAMSRIGQILDVIPEITSGPDTSEQLPARLELRNLELDLGGKRVLDGISLRVPEGRTLGIVGPIGSGKSSLVRALVRQVEVEPATVFVGGKDIHTLDLHALRGCFGFVHQQPLLFSKSVGENVAFGNPGADREAILNALKAARFESDLKVLPQGLDTPVGERGITLSGGQKQRTAIARALLLDPPILVLDDALSAVDGGDRRTHSA